MSVMPVLRDDRLRCGDLAYVPAQFGVCESWQARRPRVPDSNRQVASHFTDPSLQDCRVRPCASERPVGDRGHTRVALVS